MRVLLVGDIHLSDKPPVNATDEYTDDIIDMLKWIGTYAEKHAYDFVILTGDIFHHKAPSKNSHALVLKMLGVIQHYQRLGVTIMSVIGNHDISSDRLDSVDEKQPIGVLFAAGLVRLEGWVGDLLYGIPWQQQWDKTLEDVFAPVKDTGALVVTHASIFPKGQEPIYDYLDPKRLEAAAGDVSIYHGHIHDYHGVHHHGVTQIANMGSLNRGSLTESNMTRKIKVASWDSDTKEFEEIDVPHKPAEEVFRVAPAEERKARARDDNDFLRTIGQTRITTATPESVIQAIREKEVPDAVKTEAVRLVEAES